MWRQDSKLGRLNVKIFKKFFFSKNRLKHTHYTIRIQTKVDKLLESYFLVEYHWINKVIHNESKWNHETKRWTEDGWWLKTNFTVSFLLLYQSGLFQNALDTLVIESVAHQICLITRKLTYDELSWLISHKKCKPKIPDLKNQHHETC